MILTHMANYFRNENLKKLKNLKYNLFVQEFG